MVYETREVLAGAYAGKNPALKTMLTHTVEVDASTAAPRDVRVLCSRVKLDHIADPCAGTVSLNDRPSCPTCARRDPRFK